jgi:transcription termination factor Rho
LATALVDTDLDGQVIFEEFKGTGKWNLLIVVWQIVIPAVMLKHPNCREEILLAADELKVWKLSRTSRT